MKAVSLIGVVCALPSAAATAESARPGIASVAVAAVSQAVVPANTDMVVRLDEKIGSDCVRVGQRAAVSVMRDVVVGGIGAAEPAFAAAPTSCPATRCMDASRNGMPPHNPSVGAIRAWGE